MITRRCSERRFLMRPDAETTNAFIYCLAVAAARFQIDIIFTAALSNHHHTGILDRRGRLPEFLAYFHKLFAKHQNALRGRWENFWAGGEQTSVVELVGSEDVLDKMIYALGNAVKDHLVEKVHHWPGVDAFSAIVNGVPLVASRPSRFFRRDGGPMPEAATLNFARPPGLEGLTEHDFVSLLRERMADLEAAAAAERARTGARVLGRKGILRQRWCDRPSSREPRRQLNPRVACRNKWRRIETLARNKVFVEAYRAARDLWLAGQPCCFPAGTYWLRRHASVACAPHGPPT